MCTHPPHAACKAEGGHHRQPLGHGGDGQGYPCLDHLGHRMAAHQPHADGQKRKAQRQPHQPMAQLVEPLFQRRDFALGALHQGADPAKRGMHACGDDQTLTRALRDRGALIGHIGMGGAGRIIIANRRGLGDGNRLARQNGLVDLKVFPQRQAQIGGHHIARFQQDQIARYQIARIDHALRSSAAHAAAHLGDLHQRFHRAGAFEFGEKADGAVDQQDDKDRHRLGHIAQEEGKQRRRRQEPDNHTLDLVQQDRQDPLWPLAAQHVGAKPAYARFGLVLAQALYQIRIKGCRYGIRCHRMGGNAFEGWRGHRMHLDRGRMPRLRDGFGAFLGLVQDILGGFAFGGHDPPGAMGAKAHPMLQILGHAFEGMALPFRDGLQCRGGFGRLSVHLAQDIQGRAHGGVAARIPCVAIGLGLVEDTILRAPKLFELWRP